MIRTTQDWARSSLQTATISLRRADIDRRVVLVGVIHVGLPAYYEAISRLIESHEAAGGVVLYEGLGSLSEAEVEQLTPRERSIYRALAPLHELYGALAGSLGLRFQGEAIAYNRERWLNADVPLRELLERWAASGAPLLPLGVADAKIVFPDAPLARGLTGFMLLQTPLLLAAATRLRGWIPPLAKLSELLVSDRNRAALDVLESTDPKRDALILYGAGHVAGLIEGLVRRGYRQTGRRWLTAYSQRAPWLGLFDVAQDAAERAARR